MENKEQDHFLIKDLWVEYEKVAMHFNDLLLKLRVQALAALAAISAAIGIFAKAGTNTPFDWEIVTAIFIALLLFWIAIWLVDMLYYNQLLRGAISATISLEKLSETTNYVKKIELSTKIKDTVERQIGEILHQPIRKHAVFYFYCIVTFTLLLAIAFSIWNYHNSLNLGENTQTTSLQISA